MIDSYRPILAFAVVVWLAFLASDACARGIPKNNRRASTALRVYRVPTFELGWEHVAFPLKLQNGRSVTRLEDRLSSDNRAAAHRALTSLETAAFKGLRLLDLRTDRITLMATRAQTEAFSFVVESDAMIPSLTVRATDLVGGRRKINAQNVEIWLVHPWLQAGRSVYVDRAVIVPELLLKTDIGLKFSDSYDGAGRYHPPKIRLEGPVTTSVNAGAFKRFLVTVSVPIEARPGHYSGDLLLILDGSATFTLRIDLEVPDITLRVPQQKLLVYYDGKPEFPAGTDVTADRRFVQDIRYIRSLGYTGLRLDNYRNPAHLVKALGMIRSAGLSGPIVQGSFFEDGLAIARSFDYTPYFYGVDEPDTHDRMEEHVRESRKVHANGGKVATAITRTGAVSLADPDEWNEPLDLINYDQDQEDFWEYVRALYDGKAIRPSAMEVFYWQVWVEKPDINRLFHGFYLWKTGLDGVFPWIFGRVGSTSPYNSGDTAQSYADQRAGRRYRQFFLVYPAKDGPIPTLNSEAIRQGITDLQLLATLQHMVVSTEGLNGPVEAVRKEAEASIARILGRLDWNLRMHTADSYRPYGWMSSEEIDGFRTTVLQCLLNLSAALQRGTQREEQRLGPRKTTSPLKTQTPKPANDRTRYSDKISSKRLL